MTITAAVLFLVALAGCASAPRPTSTPVPTATPARTASPAPTEAPTAAPVKFMTVTSPMFGWSADIPDTWRLRAATGEWPAHTYPEAGAAYTDNMEPPTGGFPALDVSVQSLPADQTAEQFVQFFTTENSTRGYEVLEEEQITVDGVSGRLQRQTFFGEGIFEVLIVNDGLAYAIYWVDLENQLDGNEQLFRQIIDTFKFPTS